MNEYPKFGSNSFKGEDVLYGRNGRLEIGGILFGNVRRIALRPRVQRATLKFAGTSADRHRRIGWNGDGNLTIYRINHVFMREMLDSIDFKKKMPVFTLHMGLVNNDADASGNYDETIEARDVKFWEYDWMFDVDDFVELPLGFTFEGIDYPLDLNCSFMRRNLQIPISITADSVT